MGDGERWGEGRGGAMEGEAAVVVEGGVVEVGSIGPEKDREGVGVEKHGDGVSGEMDGIGVGDEPDGSSVGEEGDGNSVAEEKDENSVREEKDSVEEEKDEKDGIGIGEEQDRNMVGEEKDGTSVSEEKAVDSVEEEKAVNNVEEEKDENSAGEEKDGTSVSEEKDGNSVEEEKDGNSVREEKDGTSVGEEEDENTVGEEKDENTVGEEKKGKDGSSAGISETDGDVTFGSEMEFVTVETEVDVTVETHGDGVTIETETEVVTVETEVDDHGVPLEPDLRDIDSGTVVATNFVELEDDEEAAGLTEGDAVVDSMKNPVVEPERTEEWFRDLFSQGFGDAIGEADGVKAGVERSHPPPSHGLGGVEGLTTRWDMGRGGLTSSFSSSTAYVYLQKAVESFAVRDSMLSPSASYESEEDMDISRKAYQWSHEEVRVLEQAMESLHGKDKNVKKWLRGNKRLMKDLDNPKRKGNWPTGDDLDRAIAAASLATEAVFVDGDRPPRDSRLISLSIIEGELSSDTSTRGRRNSSYLSSGFLDELRHSSDLPRPTTKSLSTRLPSKRVQTNRSSKKPHFSECTVIIPDSTIMEILQDETPMQPASSSQGDSGEVEEELDRSSSLDPELGQAKIVEDFYTAL